MTTKNQSYNISKLVQLPMLSGIVPVKLFPRTSLKKCEEFMRREKRQEI